MQKQENQDWDLVIKGHTSLFDLRLGELWNYIDLLFLFVRRDFVTVCKQTNLGSSWFFIQPLLITITFTIIFGNVAQLPTHAAPKLVFYMAGITLWCCFFACLINFFGVFNTNAGIFAKVNFLRLITPLTIVISNSMKFFVLCLVLIGFGIFYTVQNQ